jgi:anaerobic ribonucleoside-triphosphate reductase activating protein
MKLSLSRIHFPVTALGPGRRLGIWFQGCSIRCPGCISADTWAKKMPGLEIAELIEQIQPWLSECDGFTISGGEPFEQEEALTELLLAIRSRSAKSILVYSGQALEQLLEQKSVKEGLIDCLVSDPFRIDSPQTLPLRGSDNQRMSFLTSLGKKIFGSTSDLSTTQKRLDVMFDNDGVVWLAGIPMRGDMQNLEKLLASRGHTIKTTESKA